MVVSHALLVVNALLPYRSKILPSAEVLVVDEAHALDVTLSDKLGVNISRQITESCLNSLLNLDKKGVFKGLLSKSQPLFSSVEYLRSELTMFWDVVVKGQKNRTIHGRRICVLSASSLVSADEGGLKLLIVHLYDI